MSDAEILSVPNFGRKCLNELKIILSHFTASVAHVRQPTVTYEEIGLLIINEFGLRRSWTEFVQAGYRDPKKILDLMYKAPGDCGDILEVRTTNMGKFDVL